MAHRRNLRDEDIETELICHTDSYEYVENTKLVEDEDHYTMRKNNHDPTTMKTL